jgi:hypothetical protein
MKSTSSYFQMKYGMALGDRLSLRLAFKRDLVDLQIEALLREAGIEGPMPSNITVGYYRALPQPVGAICFMPIPTPTARAALRLAVVQERICRDLLLRLGAAGTPGWADDEEHHNT